jgi:hypothetical protein
VTGSVAAVSGSSVTVSVSGLSALTAGTALHITNITVDGYSSPSSGSVEIGTIDTITTQPVSQSSVASGSNVVFTAAAYNSADTVQWEVSGNGGISFTPISGATATTLTINGVTNALNNNEYEAVFTDTYGTLTTNPATLLLAGSAATTTTLTDNGPSPSLVFTAVSFTATVTGSVSPISGETVRPRRWL